jgi:hypothetical protein
MTKFDRETFKEEFDLTHIAVSKSQMLSIEKNTKALLKTHEYLFKINCI